MMLRGKAPLAGGIAIALMLASTAYGLPIRKGAAINADGSIDTAWPSGDKPIVGASCSTWTCEALGVAVGEIDEVSATELDMAVSSPNDWDSVVVAHKAFASGDVQVCATIPDQGDWTGYKENFTDFGVTIQEGVGAGAFWFRVFMPNVNDVPRRKFGTESSNSSQQCALASGAVELCATYDESTTTFQGWQFDGSNYIACGDSHVRDAGALAAGVWGTSQEAGQTSFATLTGVTATNTITVFTPAGAPSFTAGPAGGTPTVSQLPMTFTVDQTGNVHGVACPDGQTFPTTTEIRAQQCTGNVAAAASFTEPVVANVADSASYTGLAANTTYDTHKVAVSVNGESARATVADQTTDSNDPDPPGDSSCPLAPRSFPPTNATINSAERITSDIACRTGPDIVLGYDFSLPPDTPIAERSGLFGGNLPTNLKGKRLLQCNIKWKDIEPTNDNANANSINAAGFDWSTINQCINNASNYDGVLIQLRHTVVEIEDCTGNTPNGTPKHTDGWTAPDWAAAIAALDPKGCHPQDFQVTNLNLDNASVRAELLELIRAFGAQNYKTLDNFWVVAHVASSSRGEECCGGLQDSTVNAIAAEWASAWGANAWKVAWIKDVPAVAFATAVTNGGMGFRGGIMENCQRIQYSPGTAGVSGRSLDADGHLFITPNYRPITELRQFMEELEFHTLTEQTYFICAMHAMHMRRNLLWIVNGADINFQIDDWMGAQMGHSVASQPEGWIWLMESRSPPVSNPKTLHNLERGIKQREELGATSSQRKVAHVDDLTGQSNFIDLIDATNCNFGGSNQCDATAFAKRENNASNVIGFALEDAWWPTSLTRDAVVKVTYYDMGNATVTLRSSSGATLGSFATGNTGTIRTATLFVDDFAAPASGDSKDFDLHFTAPVDISMVRIIKNGGACGSHTCATW